MKYYLGRLNKGKYEPINCIEETDILSVINFTSSFDSELDLKKDLVNKGLINGNESLAYIYKKNEDFHKMKNGSSIAYSYSKEYLEPNDLYRKMKEEIFNLDLYKYIASIIQHDLRKVDHPVAELKNINELLNEINLANSIGVDKYNETNDKKNINYLLMKFLTSYLGIWDKERKVYKTTNGRIDTKKRRIVDLILILNSYYEDREKEEVYSFIAQVENEDNKPSNNQSTDDEFDDYEKEEFLTEEDFESHGMDPDEYKRLIRK